MSTALTVVKPETAALERQQQGQGLALRTLDDFTQLGNILARSGYFADVRDAAQAVVKVLYGQELGFGPITSMTGVHIVKNKPCLSANLIAAKIKESGRYDFRVLRLDNDGCELEFYENGKPLTPTSKFDTEDALRAELLSGPTRDGWKKYPRNFHFARAITNGARWHCPGIFKGPINTPEELGANVDAEGAPIDITPTPINEAVISQETWDKIAGKDEPEPASNVRPIQSKAGRAIGNDPDEGWQIDQHTRITVFGLCAELEKLKVKEEVWRKRMKEVTGVSSRKELTGPLAAALMQNFARWIADIKSIDEGDPEPVGPTREELQKEIEKAIRTLVNEYEIDFHGIKAEMKRISKKELRKELDLAESLKVRDGFDEWIKNLKTAKADADAERAAIQAEGSANA